MLDDEDRPESFEVDVERSKETRRGIDLATTLERIPKNFVITDPRLPDNPIVSTATFILSKVFAPSVLQQSDPAIKLVSCHTNGRYLHPTSFWS